MGRTRGLWPGLRDALARLGLRFDEAETPGPGAAMRLAREAAAAGSDLVVAVGGDGTVNEVVNGLMSAAAEARPALGVIATGRGRDAARTLALPSAAWRALERLVRERVRVLDLGLAEWPGGGRYFLNAAGAGFDAAVAAEAVRLGGRGTLPYLRAVLRGLRDYEPVPAALEREGLVEPGRRLAGVVVANGPCFGGGMRIAPGADPADGVLDLVALGPFGRAELVCWLPTIYWGGHLRNGKVSLERVRRASIDPERPWPVQLDGEPCGRTPLSVRVCPGVLRVRG
jgi:YegS/Rv2252/BmrU family lipid kinase